MRSIRALITLGPMPSHLLVGNSVQPAFYNFAAVTKVLLSCFDIIQLYKERIGQSLQEIRKLSSDLRIVVNDVLRMARENLGNDDHFRQRCVEKGEDWSSVALVFLQLIHKVGLNAITRGYVNTAWYDIFRNLQNDVQKKK